MLASFPVTFSIPIQLPHGGLHSKSKWISYWVLTEPDLSPFVNPDHQCALPSSSLASLFPDTSLRTFVWLSRSTLLPPYFADIVIFGVLLCVFGCFAVFWGNFYVFLLVFVGFSLLVPLCFYLVWETFFTRDCSFYSTDNIGNSSMFIFHQHPFACHFKFSTAF
jgi:hypothetical protein